MVISKKNYISKLYFGDSVRCDVPAYAASYEDSVSRFMRKTGKVKPKVYLISKVFFNQLEEAFDVILDAWLTGQISLPESTRFILMTPGVKSYIVDAKPIESGVLGRFVEYNDKGQVESYFEVNGCRSDGYSVSSKSKSAEIRVWLFPLITYLFMEYGEVQTVRVCNDKIAVPDFGVIRNKTGMAVTTVTSNWLNNIVRDTGFKVKGHFRLQPFGPGLKDRKLIWISSFEKKGYNRVNDRWREMPSKN